MLTLSNNIIAEPDYALLQNLSEFFDHIRQISKSYSYISATERRCFNLIARCLPEIDMLSSSALKLYCGEMADFYRKNSFIPRILVLDDIMVRGRSIAKLLAQLESLIEEELGDILTTPESITRFHSSFTDAVDIYVYAKNRGSLFLSKRFQQKLRFEIELYAGQLRDLSFQMSHWLSQNEVANTSFVSSIRSKSLTDFLEKDTTNAASLWSKTEWKYQGEKMVLFYRTYGDDQINRISTIRFFPDRAKEQSPQVTSFTLFGDLNTPDFSNLCTDLSKTLRDLKCLRLSDILNSKRPLHRINQGQLLCYTLSNLDLFDFLQSNLTEKLYQRMLDELRVDLNKIACQFGRRDDVRKELLSVIGNPIVRWHLKQTISPWIAQHAAPLLSFGTSLDPTLKTQFSAHEMVNINDLSERLFYQIGWEGEDWAAEINRTPDKFSAVHYQNYKQCNDYGDKGIISLYDYFKLCQKKDSQFQTYFNGYLNAFIAMMDKSVMSARMSLLGQGSGAEKISILSKTGELSAFYVPRKLALLLPAFAEIEYRSFALEPEAKTKEALRFVQAVQSVCSEYCLPGFDQKDMASIRDDILPYFYPENLKEDIFKLYHCGQSFGGWNFYNTTSIKDSLCQKFQNYLKNRASLFLSFPADESAFYKAIIGSDIKQ